MKAGAALAAGSMFGGSALIGMLAGVWLARQTGSSLWVPFGLLGGVMLGAYGALRMLMAAGKG